MLHCVVTSDNVYISDHNNGLRATASADNMGSYWWVGRVLVEPVDRRSGGHGSRLLQMLIQEVVKQGGTEIHVAPGGYNADPKKQFAFYCRHGFKVVPGEPGLLIWRHRYPGAIGVMEE